MTYYDEIMADTPRAWYRFPGAGPIPNGTVCPDASGNARNGTYAATSSYPHSIVPGPLETSEVSTAIARALGSPLTSGYATVGTGQSPLPVGNFTGSLEAWVKAPTMPSGGNLILGGWGYSGGSRSLVLLVESSFNLKFGVYVSPASGATQTASATVPFAPYVDDVWHHLVGVFEGGVAKLYVDGELIAQASVTGTPPFKIYNGINEAQIGKPAGGSSEAPNGWSGPLAECAIYDQALSPERVLVHYQAAFPQVSNRLKWDEMPERIYETGTDHGVLYPRTGNGVVWNGLISVTENVSGGSVESYYKDGVKYLDVVTGEDYNATIEAYGAPYEFAEHDGMKSLAPGLFATAQRRRPFDFSYRTLVGNPLEGEQLGYKLHLVYNALASPAQKKFQTTDDEANPSIFQWTINGVPVVTTSGPFHKPTAHLIVDSRYADPVALKNLEEELYGDDFTSPHMPTQEQVISILEG